MKLRITFKDPDVVDDAIKEAVSRSIAGLGLTDREEICALHEARAESVREKVAKWFEYGEYVTIEVDTDADTAVVVPTP